MTTPSGVPNLPLDALTLDTLADKLQDMTATAMHGRAGDHMPSIFDLSTGGNILSDLTPFGIITRIWAEFNSLIANADPADVQGPDDLPGLLLDFINGLPGHMISFVKQMLLTLVEFLRAVPVLNDLIAPFLDAIEDLVNDIPETILGFLDPIEWAKRLLRFAAQFVRGIPVLGDLIAPFIDAVEDMVNDIPETMLDLLNPLTWMGWISGGFLSQFGLDFDWLTGLTGTNLGGLSFFTSIPFLLGNPVGLMSGAPTLGGFESIPLFGPIGAILQQILAFLQGGPLSFVGGGSLVDNFTSLLTRPFFNDSSAVAGGGIWTVDDTVTYNGQGSVKVIADGTVKELVGNPVGVSPGQKITASVRAQWSGLTGSGSPIRLMVWTDQGDQPLDSIPFSTSGTFTDLPNNPLTGSYTVASNVTQAAMLLVVEAQATGGTVWFNDQQSNMLPVASVVEDVVGLSGIFDDLFDIFGGSTGSSGKSLANVFDIGKDFFDVLAGILGADFGDLTLRFNEILQVFQSIAGIIVTPITSLVQDVIDRLLNLTTSGLFDSSALTNIANIPVLAQTRISNLVQDLGARLTTTSFDDMRDRLAGSFLGVGSFNVNDNQGLADKFGDFFEVIANAPHNWTNLQNSITRNYQTFDILRGQVVTPIDSIIQGIKTWYDANFP